MGTIVLQHRCCHHSDHAPALDVLPDAPDFIARSASPLSRIEDSSHGPNGPEDICLPRYTSAPSHDASAPRRCCLILTHYGCCSASRPSICWMTYGEYCESYDGSEIFTSLSSLSATPCLVLPRALHVDAVDIFLSSIYIGFQGKYFSFFFFLCLCYHVSYVALLCFVYMFLEMGLCFRRVGWEMFSLMRVCCFPSGLISCFSFLFVS